MISVQPHEARIPRITTISLIPLSVSVMCDREKNVDSAGKSFSKMITEDLPNLAKQHEPTESRSWNKRQEIPIKIHHSQNLEQ